MHIIQQKILNLAKEQNLASLTLRKIGELIGQPDSPQKIKHHLDKLIEKGLLLPRADGKVLQVVASGFDKKTKLISLPIIGSANCGLAMAFADEKIEGYLKVSLHALDDGLAKHPGDLYVLRAIGDSMNRANVRGESIEEGDYVVVDKTVTLPSNGDYVISVIDGLSNIKRFYDDKKNDRIILFSESTMDVPPIYIKKNDFIDYLICGKVVAIFKDPAKEDELKLFMDAAGQDILKELGPISKEEYDYYTNL